MNKLAFGRCSRNDSHADRRSRTTATDRRPSVPRYRRWGLGVSAVLHVMILVGLLIGSFRNARYDGWASREARVVYVSLAEGDAEHRPEPAAVVATEVADVTGSMVRERIRQVAEEAGARPDPENLDRLDQLTERLSEVSSEGAVDQLARSFHRMLGTTERASEPAAGPVGGEFDPQTAQFHDVRREVQNGQEPRYLAILIDAEGRRLEVAMEASEGERMYALMQRIKDNPLLERVYRRIAMPLLDQLLAAPAAANR